jgi:putative transposase
MSSCLIAVEKSHHSVSRLARMLGVSRAGFSAWQERPLSARASSDAALSKRIGAIHENTDGIYAVPRIHAELADEYSIHVGRTRVARLMRPAGIQGVCRRRFRSARRAQAAKRPPLPISSTELHRRAP